MKKGILKTLAIASLLFFTNGVFVFAQEQTSEINIGFTSGDTTPTEPVDPDNPDEPGTGPGTGMSGPLSIDHIPILDFGEKNITGRVETYEVLNLKPYLQVTDKRGSGEGWRVTLNLSAFTDDELDQTFNGSLQFRNADIRTTTGNTSGEPISEDFAIASNESYPIFRTIEDEDDQGLGIWLAVWEPENSTSTNDSITLTANTANIRTGTYAAQLQWVLTDGP